MIALSLVLGTWSPVTAEENNKTERRPEEIEQLRTQTAYTLKQGEFEIDLVSSFVDFTDQENTINVAGIVAELEYGITDRIMVELEIPYLYRSPELDNKEVYGIGDIELEIKWLMYDQPSIFSAALGIGSSFLIGDEGKKLGSEGTELEMFLALSKHLDWLDLHLHGELELAEGADPEGKVNFALEHQLGDKELFLQFAVNTEIEDEIEMTIIPGIEFAF